jgi:Smg protein
MFEVLAFVYENYWRGDACPQPAQLERKLTAVGFESAEIQDALVWLEGLNLIAQGFTQDPGKPQDGMSPPCTPGRPMDPATAMRVYSSAEQDQLGCEGLGLISFLESAQALSGVMREIVVDRAMASPASPLALDDLKIIVLLVYWRLGQEPAALVLDALCPDQEGRLAH